GDHHAVPGDVRGVPAQAEGGELHHRPGSREARSRPHLGPLRSTTVDGMVPIRSGTFLMGSNDHYAEEAPARRVAVAGFRIDRCQTTNREFAAFVRDTGYVTVAERPLDPRDFP